MEAIPAYTKDDYLTSTRPFEYLYAHRENKFELKQLLGIMSEQAKGVGIIFVTHFLEQVYEVCDRITVLRDGGLVGEYVIEDLPRVQLVAKMLGKELDDLADIKGDQPAYQAEDRGAPVLEAKQLASTAGIKPFDFAIYKGEVNGFTGLLGSGRSECVRAIFGADRTTGGTVRMDGKEVRIRKPLDAMKHGIGYLPEDRKQDGIVGDLSVRENIILALQVMKGFFRPFSKAQAEAFADEYIKLLEIKTASSDTPIKSLSGGNQQKVILARELEGHPDLLVAVHPTRGLDIGATRFVHDTMIEAREKGCGVLLISADFDEILEVSDRIVVMFEGQVMGVFSGKEPPIQEISLAMAGK